jgi:hypothetical protein
MGILGKSSRRNIGNMVAPKIPVKPKIPVAPKMPRRKPRTQLIDPRLPRGKVGKGPLEPRDSTTRVPAERKGLAGVLNNLQAMDPPKLKKGPGMKNGGSVMKYKDGGCVAGAANRRRMMQETVNK